MVIAGAADAWVGRTAMGALRGSDAVLYLDLYLIPPQASCVRRGVLDECGPRAGSISIPGSRYGTMYRWVGDPSQILRWWWLRLRPVAVRSRSISISHTCGFPRFCDAGGLRLRPVEEEVVI